MAKRLHSQQINSEYISVLYVSVSYNAALTSHMFKIDTGGDNSYENAPSPCELKNSLFRKQAEFHRGVFQQQTYIYATPRAAWRKKGGDKAFGIFFFLLNKTCMNPSSEQLTTEVHLIFASPSSDDKERWNFAVLHEGNAAMALCTKAPKIQIGSDTNPSMNLSRAFSTLVFLWTQIRMCMTVISAKQKSPCSSLDLLW